MVIHTSLSIFTVKFLSTYSPQCIKTRKAFQNAIQMNAIQNRLCNNCVLQMSVFTSVKLFYECLDCRVVQKSLPIITLVIQLYVLFISQKL